MYMQFLSTKIKYVFPDESLDIKRYFDEIGTFKLFKISCSTYTFRLSQSRMFKIRSFPVVAPLNYTMQQDWVRRDKGVLVANKLSPAFRLSVIKNSGDALPLSHFNFFSSKLFHDQLNVIKKRPVSLLQ